MPPSGELEVQFGPVEPRDSLWEAMPGDFSEDWVMRPAGVSYAHLAGDDVYIGLAPDEVPKELLRIALFEASELLGQPAV